MDINSIGKKGSVLYVDDEDSNLTLFKFAFGRKYDVILANSGHEGLQILDTVPSIKLIISDMKMPIMNGIEFINQVKVTRSNMPCAILSGYLKDEETERMIEDGLIVEYLMKPFEREHITSLLEKYVGSTHV